MPPLEYVDLDLEVDRTSTGYHAQIANSPAGQAGSDFTLPFSDLELKYLLLQLGGRRASTRRVETAEMEAAKTFGSKLFNAVFNGDMKSCLATSLYAAEQQASGVRVRLRLAGAPELTDLPWEYLYNPSLNRFLSLSVRTPLVRYLDLPERIRPLTVRPPLNVLVMIADPSDYPALDVEVEYARLNTALAQVQAQGLVTLERLQEASLAALTRRLRSGEFHILHFVGHGVFDERMQDGMLILCDAEKKGRPVSAQNLGTVLHDHSSLRLAVLNSCEGARTSQSDPFSGAAQSLVQQGIPAVIAMQFEITDTAAISFSQEFYGALVQGYPVDGALAEARKTIFAEGNQLEWATPVLYMRAPDGRIFDMQQISTAEREEKARKNQELLEKAKHIGSLLQQAESARAAGDWPGAAESARQILALDPTHAPAKQIQDQARQAIESQKIYTSAQQAFAAGGWTEAIKLFESLHGYRDADKWLKEARAKEQEKLEKIKRDSESQKLVTYRAETKERTRQKEDKPAGGAKEEQQRKPQNRLQELSTLDRIAIVTGAASILLAFGGFLGIFLWVIVGAVAATAANQIKRASYGLAGDLIAGSVGALFGGFVTSTLLGISSYAGVSIYSIIGALIGAVIMIVLSRALTPRSTGA